MNICALRNDDGTNAELRRTRGMNAFDHGGYTLEAVVDDLSGLDPTATQQIDVQTPDRWSSPTPPNVPFNPL